MHYLTEQRYVCYDSFCHYCLVFCRIFPIFATKLNAYAT